MTIREDVMRLASTFDHKLQFSAAPAEGASPLPHGGFGPGLELLGELMPGGLAAGAVHEVLTRPGRQTGTSFALLLARHALAQRPDDGSAVIWFDPAGELYPPALSAVGIPLERLLVLRATSKSRPALGGRRVHAVQGRGGDRPVAARQDSRAWKTWLVATGPSKSRGRIWEFLLRQVSNAPAFCFISDGLRLCG